MRITAEGWQMLLRACSDVAQIGGYIPTPSSKPALLRKTGEAVDLLNKVASDFPERFCRAARDLRAWPVMWVDEISARIGFSEMIEKLVNNQSQETNPGDFALFKQVCDAVEALTNTAAEDIARFAQYLDPCGWPVLIPLVSGKQRVRQIPVQPEIVSLLSDASSPVFRLYRLGTKNTSKRPLRIDLGTKLNQMTGVLYGITQILWCSKRVLAFDCPNRSKLDSRIRVAVSLWQKRTMANSVVACSALEVITFLEADTSKPSADAAFAVMLEILKCEAGGPGMILESLAGLFPNVPSAVRLAGLAPPPRQNDAPKRGQLQILRP